MGFLDSTAPDASQQVFRRSWLSNEQTVAEFLYSAAISLPPQSGVFRVSAV